MTTTTEPWNSPPAARDITPWHSILGDGTFDQLSFDTLQVLRDEALDSWRLYAAEGNEIDRERYRVAYDHLSEALAAIQPLWVE